VKFVARAIATSLGSALLVSSLAQSAKAIGGDQFISLCSNTADKSDHDFCLGYVFAIAEALHGLPDQAVCIQEASPEALLDAVMGYIGGLPELVVTALEASFPC
jgi:hypothetical protein